MPKDACTDGEPNKIMSFCRSPKYMYGYEAPRDYDHAMEIDRQNGNTKWADAIDLEMGQIMDYETFQDHGPRSKGIPAGYKKIRVHLVFAVKHDGRHKARLVADGHLTDVPVESVYSGVISLHGLRIVIFLGELNGLGIWSTDIGNEYLEAHTKEKVCIIAGPEFNKYGLEGHILIIKRALYGLRTSGKCWYERLSDCLREMGFTPSKAEQEVWM